MTQQQAEILANSIANLATALAEEFLDTHTSDSRRFKQSVAHECRKCFLSQLHLFNLITPLPPKPTIASQRFKHLRPRLIPPLPPKPTIADSQTAHPTLPENLP